MMNSTETMNPSTFHKMVVGIGLALVFGVGVSVFAVSARHDSQIARNAASALDQSATDVTAPAPSAPTEMPSDPTATAPNAAPDIAPVVAPAPPAPVASNVSKDAGAKKGSDDSKLAAAKASDDRRIAITRSRADSPEIRVASIAPTNRRSADESASKSSDTVTSNSELASAPVVSDRPSLAPESATADALPAPAQTGQQEATSAAPTASDNEPVASDSQITSNVKTEIAVAAPNSNIDVTTTNGVVALAGSVPSQDAVEQARRAARGISGVKFVDVSALLVNQ